MPVMFALPVAQRTRCRASEPASTNSPSVVWRRFGTLQQPWSSFEKLVAK